MPPPLTKTPSVAKPPPTELPLPNKNETGVETQYAGRALAISTGDFKPILGNSKDVQETNTALNRPAPGLTRVTVRWSNVVATEPMHAGAPE